MVIIWGESLYGKVDHVPGLCYVSTRFFHLYYLPLIPLQSLVIIDGSETSDGYRGVNIGLSIKSVLCAWLRVAALIFGVVYTVMLVLHTIRVAQGHPDSSAWRVAEALGLAAAGFGLLWATYRYTRANIQRALHLGKTLGLEPEQMAVLFVHDPAVQADSDEPKP